MMSYPVDLFQMSPSSSQPTHSKTSKRPAAARFLTESLERRVLLANVPDGFSDTIIASSLDSPTAMVVAPDGRIFVAGQKGHLYIIDGDQVLNPLTIPNIDSQDERGFVGIELDPAFNDNGFFYVFYTQLPQTSGADRMNRIARYQLEGNTVVGSETLLFQFPILGSIFHMGGALHFGQDGRLYVAVGDHLQFDEAQELDNIYGKILRINSNGSIPTNNPFFGQTTGMARAIWAYGLRNPFTFNFHPNTGMMLINDVGQDAWEEINVGEAGANYGWPLSEGPDNTSGFTAPVYFYGRTEGTAITGGAFYVPQTDNFPGEFVDKYFFSDLTGNWIRALDTSNFTATEFATDLSFPVDIDVAPDGALLYLQRGTGITTGAVGRIQFGSMGAPTLVNQPQSQTVAVGADVSFSVQANGAGTLRYQWQFNDSDIIGATSPTLTLEDVQADDAGSYRVRVTNDFGSVTSSPATLTVLSSSAPEPVIETPAAGTTFRAGQTFSFSGGAVDADDGQLGADRLSWRVDYHTGTVVRPFFPETSGISEGTFTIPTQTPYKGTDVFYRIHLTATDNDGLSTTVTRDIQPITARITLRSNVSGAEVLLDGQPQTTPKAFNGVGGVLRILNAPERQTLGGINYIFDGWSDGGAREHQVLTPLDDFTYVARYREEPNSATKGLGMTIFNNRDRTGTVVTQNVNTIDFDWGEGSPDPLIHPDTFFIRFRGKVQPEFSETYTFYARANDGVRLFVNGQLLIDQWNDSDGSELSGSIDLEAGVKYDLRFDYYENVGAASAQLQWSSDSTPKQVIPRSKLFSKIMPTMLYTTADTFVQGGSGSSTNFGQRSSMIVKSAGNEQFQREAYFKFDISELDLEAIGSAKLRLYGRLSSGDQEINVPIALHHAPKAKWGENSITWESRPSVASKAISSAVVTNEKNQIWEFDITEFLRAEKQAGHSIVTFVLRNLDRTNVWSIFASREAAHNGPQIVVAV